MEGITAHSWVLGATVCQLRVCVQWPSNISIFFPPAVTWINGCRLCCGRSRGITAVYTCCDVAGTFLLGTWASFRTIGSRPKLTHFWKVDRGLLTWEWHHFSFSLERYFCWMESSCLTAFFAALWICHPSVFFPLLFLMRNQKLILWRISFMSWLASLLWLQDSLFVFVLWHLD